MVFIYLTERKSSYGSLCTGELCLRVPQAQFQDKEWYLKIVLFAFYLGHKFCG